MISILHISFRSIVVLLLCTFYVSVLAQEICDNGIDDNGNGLIDLNDEDCKCSSIINSSLIPNPSFEDRTCCPSANAMLNCADSWIQASNPTTDYVHTCGNYLGNTSIPAFAPLPFPDGEGAVGFRDGQANVGSNYKEYVGACLTEAMVPGVKYRLDFFVGFQDNVTGSKNLNLSFFAADNCNKLPFGSSNTTIGCPTNTGQYKLLKTIPVSGNNEWVNVVVEFTPSEFFTVLVIGPACGANPNFIFDPYFYIDRLALAEESDFGIPLSSIDGSICQNGVQLSVENNTNNTYQWYLNGVAIANETSSSIDLQMNGSLEGVYQVVIFNTAGCTVSKEYDLRIPPYFEDVEAEICELEKFEVGTNFFDSSGFFEVELLASDGCDSIVLLTLDVNENTEENLKDTLCEGDTYMFFDETLTSAGTYEQILSNSRGCDSLLTLSLVEIPSTTGLELPSQINVPIGELATIIPENIDPNLIFFEWEYQNEIIHDDASLIDFLVTNDSEIILIAYDKYGCSVENRVQLLVDKSNLKIHMPNVFSPDGNNINDTFGPFLSPVIAVIEEMVIFDRWGNKVYEVNNESTDLFKGWDGLIHNRWAVDGVYGYYIKVQFIDGSSKKKFGDLLLMK